MWPSEITKHTKNRELYQFEGCSFRAITHSTFIPFVLCNLCTSNTPFLLSPVQDALFFLKDFFSNLASFVNPYLPVDPASEGELHLKMFFFILCCIFHQLCFMFDVRGFC